MSFFSFLKVGYVSSLEGRIYHDLLVASLKHARNDIAYGKWYIEFSFPRGSRLGETNRSSFLWSFMSVYSMCVCVYVSELGAGADRF